MTRKLAIAWCLKPHRISSRAASQDLLASFHGPSSLLPCLDLLPIQVSSLREHVSPLTCMLAVGVAQMACVQYSCTRDCLTTGNLSFLTAATAYNTAQLPPDCLSRQLKHVTITQHLLGTQLTLQPYTSNATWVWLDSLVRVHIQLSRVCKSAQSRMTGCLVDVCSAKPPGQSIFPMIHTKCGVLLQHISQ